MTTRRVPRSIVRCTVGALALAGAVAAATATALAQDEQPPFEPYLAVVTADKALVRSGASESYYPFGQVKRGDVVQVVGEKANWARTNSVGPAFESMFGYIKYPSTETGRFHLSPDGKTGLTLGRTDVLAPNLHTNFNPKDSWKPIARLEADQMIVVLQTLQTDRETVHRIELTADAIAWVNLAALSPATPSQVAAWESSMAGVSSTATASAARPDAGNRQPASPAPVLGRDEPAVRAVPTDGSGAAAQPVAPAATAQRDTATDPGAAAGSTETGDASADVTTAGDTTPAGVATPAQPTQTRRRTESPAHAELELLEVEYQALLDEPVDPSTLLALRQRYLNLAEQKPPVERVSAFAAARARQLKIWNDLHERRSNLSTLQSRVRDTATDANVQIDALESRVPYTAIGRLSVSTVYNGRNLPRLYRLQDAGTNRTIAYLKADQQSVDLIPMLGKLIGIVGEKSFDDGLRLNMIAPRRIDLLAPRSETTPQAEATPPAETTPSAEATP